MLLRLTPADQLGHGLRRLDSMDVMMPIAKARIYNDLAFTAPVMRSSVGKVKVSTRPTGVNRKCISSDLLG